MRPETDFPTDLRALEADYELIRELGQGGMAAVYLARRRNTGELVAIKAIRGRYLDDPEALRRFAREARTAAELNHPNIVRTEAIEQMGDRAVAIILEYIEGGTVRDRLREFGALDAERTESVLRDVASALSYAHRRGIVHRDVKPENVFLDERSGRALLSDFGIARRIEGDVPITLLGAALGTPQYMSPEQIDGGTVDGRSDIYSLGVLGWELLTGRRPWAGENLYSIIYKQKHEQLPRITSLRPRVPANLLFAIEGALVKDRNQRWQSAEEFLEQLTYNPLPVLSQSFPGAAAPPPADEPTVKFRAETAERVGTEGAPRVRSSTSAGAPLGIDGAAPEPVPDRGRDHVVRREPPPWKGKRRNVLRGLALLLPLAIAGSALYAVFGGRAGASRRDGGSVVTQSGGSVAIDSTRPSSNDTMAKRTPPARTDSSPGPRVAPRRTTPVPAPSRATDSTAKSRGSTTARAALPPPPSARCAVATMTDQRACLMAYINVIDVPLQRVYDSLMGELRGAGGATRGAPDPPAAARVRAEQRAWIVARDRECTKEVVPGSVRLWARPLAECFANVSATREAELSQALRRVRVGSQ